MMNLSLKLSYINLLVVNHYHDPCHDMKFHAPMSNATMNLQHWQLITGAQPKAGNGHKMQSVPVVFDRRIVRDISLTFFRECSLAH